MEGKLFQNFDIRLSFCFMFVEKGILKKKYKKSQKLPVFYHKIKTRA